jgi:hypothetical protein
VRQLTAGRVQRQECKVTRKKASTLKDTVGVYAYAYCKGVNSRQGVNFACMPDAECVPLCGTYRPRVQLSSQQLQPLLHSNMLTSC